MQSSDPIPRPGHFRDLLTHPRVRSARQGNAVPPLPNLARAMRTSTFLNPKAMQEPAER